jgi:phosphatidylserine/phosphatidylglycerophosphate/cardiolipin synthase-like enzyme
MIIDANSSNPDDPIVWTGSCNWDLRQINLDVNNVIILQDSALARAYTTEFNEMWGDTGLIPDSVNSKFGPYKTNNTQHLFNIGGTMVEQYFSPSDSVNTHILDAINSANDDLYFGVYTFTEVPEADSIVSKIQNQSVYTAGIIDQYSLSYAAYPVLSPVMGNMLQVYTQSTSIYHNKMMIVDPCSPLSDPFVETGSHNWTVSADTKNDENTVIVHNDTIANIYYQSFYQNFLDLGGTLTPCTNATGVQEVNSSSFNIFPNPTNGTLCIQTDNWHLITNTQVKIFNAFGKLAFEGKMENCTSCILHLNLPTGIYFLLLQYDNRLYKNRIIITR